MKHLRARRPVVLLAALALLLFYDHSGFYRISLAACLLHEGGHVLVWMFQRRRFPVLRFSLCGICMEWDGAFVTPAQELWLAAAGPLANFAVCRVWYDAVAGQLFRVLFCQCEFMGRTF